MTRILVHPGFHKTGTSSLQQGAKLNKEVLQDRLRVWNTDDVLDCVKLGRRYSSLNTDRHRIRFGRQVAETLQRLDPDDPRPVLISSEDLAGLMPGLQEAMDYDSAPILMGIMVDELLNRFGAADITVWFTTRQREPWQRSVYWQTLRATRLTEDFETYRPKLEHASRLVDVVEGTAHWIGSKARVLHDPIEDIGDGPLGPIGRALELLGVSTEGMEPIPARNIQPADASRVLLDLNRSDMADDELATAKSDYISTLWRTKKTIAAPPAETDQKTMSDDSTPSRSHGRKSISASLKPRDLMDPAAALAQAWRVQVITLFPGAFPGVLGESLTGKALKDGIWQIEPVDLRLFGIGKHRNVDDTPAGGGAGMVLRADVVGPAIEFARRKSRPGSPLVYLSPRGKRFDQAMARDWAKRPGLTMLCGRFEGVDERVLQRYNIQEVSLGDFVMTGGEIAAQAMLDATVRLLPGVLGNADSTVDESHSAGLLEHPQYTRPAEWEGLRIPDVLMSGHHGEIEKWRQEMSRKITQERRQDLWELWAKTTKE